MSSIKTSLYILTPFWIVTLGSTILILISAATSFENYQYYSHGDEFMGISGQSHYQSRLKEAFLAWGIVLVVCSVLTLLFNVFSIVLLARRHNSAPAYVLFSNIACFIVWDVLLICAFVAPPWYIDIFQLIGNCVLIGTSFGQLCYGGVLFRRMRRSKISELPMGKMMDDDDDAVFEAPFQHRKS